MMMMMMIKVGNIQEPGEKDSRERFDGGNR